jgi:SAM-dependent methyltransferase
MSQKTSWKGASDWYDSIVGEKGHFYHQHLILPNVQRLLSLRPKNRLLDLGCGQGILSRQLPKGVDYVGIDIAKPLLDAARRYPGAEKRTFIHGDLTHPWPLAGQAPFSHAACILALQNIETPEVLFEELAKHVSPGATIVFVLNHPYFRIPRQSRWGFDEATKTQTRELFSYMSPQKIPIVTHPGKGSSQTWSFHRPLSDYTKMAHQHGFVIESIEEWCSPKESSGGAARYENRARKEFPLFMALVLRSYSASQSRA